MEALEGKGYRLPLMKGEIELVEKLPAITKQLKGLGSKISKRVQNLLVISRVQANAIGEAKMVITLKLELIMNNFETINGDGVNVHIADGACVIIRFVTNIIIHGPHIHDCKPIGMPWPELSSDHGTTGGTSDTDIEG
ncbi:hypothetical protein AAG906_039657 [Vitis piasezkii]